MTFPENIYAKMGLKPDIVGIPNSVAIQFATQSFKDPWKYLTLIDGKINCIIVGGTLKRKQATGLCLFTPNSIMFSSAP